MIEKIVSKGQTDINRTALDVTINLNIVFNGFSIHAYENRLKVYN